MTMRMKWLHGVLVPVAAWLGGMAAPAHAQLQVHPVIVDLPAGALQRADIEVENAGTERSYVEIDPARIDSPGLHGEARVADADPEKLGLLTSPSKLILQPGERRFVRISALEAAGSSERIFRVAVRPVTGPIASDQSGLKVLVGYDVLVIQRPATINGTLRWSRSGNDLQIVNVGNTNVELIRGRACVAEQKAAACPGLQPRRVYPGQNVQIAIPSGATPIYTVKVAQRLVERRLEGTAGCLGASCDK
jgi:P pilus assembly chaperone PapD